MDLLQRTTGMALFCVCTILASAGHADDALSTTRTPQEDPTAPSPYWLDDVRNCGPRCLHFLEHWSGGKRRFREVSSTCPAGREGVSLAELAKAARELGMGVTPFALSKGALPRLRSVALLHVKRQGDAEQQASWGADHFLVHLCYDPERDEHLVFDPPSDVRAVSRQYLAERFTGVGLLISDDGKAPELAAALRPRSQWPAVGLFLGAIVACGGGVVAHRRGVVRGSAAALLACVAAGTLPGCSAESEPTVDMSRNFDAGEVVEGTTIEHVFHVSNDSGQPFQVDKVVTSCTCTHSFLDEDTSPLAAGERRALKVEFNTQGERGKQEKRIFVETDSADPQWKKIDYSVTAMVVREIQQIPDIVHFGTIERGKSVVRTVALEANADRWQEIVPRTIPGAHVRVEPAPHFSETRPVYSLTLEAPQINGPITDRVTFVYEKAGQQLEIVVPVQADVTGRLKALPRRITLTALDRSLGKSQRVRVSSPSGDAFRIVDIQVPAGVQRTGALNDASTTEHELSFSIDGAKLANVDGAIKITTDLAADSRLDIPVVLQQITQYK
jgi:hypothetical protein